MYLNGFHFIFFFSFVKSSLFGCSENTLSNTYSAEIDQTQIMNSPTAKYTSKSQAVVFDNGKSQENNHSINGHKENNRSDTIVTHV